MKTKRLILPIAVLFALFSVGMSACGGGQGGNGGNNSAQTQKITITSADNKKELILGESLQLTASVGGVSWESDHPEIATVSESGLVQSLTVGTVKITAKKDGYKDGTITLNIKLEKIVVTAEGETSLLAGASVTLKASKEGVTWASSDESVATVDQTGKVTAVKFGTAVISASKEGFDAGSIQINVVRPEQNAKFDLTVAAEHYSADGWWSIASSSMFGMGGEVGGGATPVTKTQSWGQETESDEYLTAFGIGDKETIKFKSDKAIKAEFVANLGNGNAITLSEVVSVKLNGAAINLQGIALEEHSQDFGGFAMVTTEFSDVSFGEADLLANENVLEFEFIAETDLCLNELSIYAGDAKIELVNPPAKEQIVVQEAQLSIIEGETVQIVTEEAGVSYVSVDAEVATVDEYGLVTGVKMGKTNITVKKEGMYSVRVEITVNPKPVSGQIVVEAEDGEEVTTDYQSGGFIKNVDGSGFGGNTVHSGGAYVSAFSGENLVLTIKFTAEEAKKMVLSVVGSAPMAWQGDAVPFVFAESATIKVNDVAVEVAADVAFPAAQGWNAEMVEVTLGEVDVIKGENTLVFELTGSSAPSLDCFKLSLKD